MPDFSTIVRELKEYCGEPLTFMEICGTHTAAISENGIADMLSDRIRLVSGPGCPVCVTVASYIDRLVELAMEENTCVVTFGDMMRVRGSQKSLRDITAEGGRVRMIYSPLEIIAMAEQNPAVQYVLAAVGFETTTPVYAILMDEIISRGINNIRLLTALKTMPAVIERLCKESGEISGFIAPGHVSVITGTGIYEPVARKYSMPFVVAGFEGEELLAAIYALVKLHNKPVVRNLYKKAVTECGNTVAAQKVDCYFDNCDAAWRGFGIIPQSGRILRKEYLQYDAGSFDLMSDTASDNGCSCPDVITGRISPNSCPMYGKVCTPDTPKGACMVSAEGNCYNYFLNKRGQI